MSQVSVPLKNIYIYMAVIETQTNCLRRNAKLKKEVLNETRNIYVCIDLTNEHVHRLSCLQ